MKKVAGDQMEADADPGEGWGVALTGRASGGPRSDAPDEAGREEVLLKPRSVRQEGVGIGS